jgi:hypothetical protein
MSTKCTIAHGKSWHLYEEWMDNDKVYLGISGVDYFATPGSIIVQLPPDVIDAIRSANSSAFPHLRGTVDGAEVMQ